MKIFFALLLTTFNLTNLPVSPTEWKVTSSSITFKIKNAGFTVDGSFSGLTADIKLDAATSALGSIEASVDANTINTGIDLRDKDLKKEEYFNVKKYPKISMKSTLFAKDKDGTFIGYFKLTIKSVTKDVVIPFSFIETGNGAVFKGSFKINRRDYTVGGNSWILSDDVTINITVNGTK